MIKEAFNYSAMTASVVNPLTAQVSELGLISSASCNFLLPYS